MLQLTTTNLITLFKLKSKILFNFIAFSFLRIASHNNILLFDIFYNINKNSNNQKKYIYNFLNKKLNYF